MWMIAADGDPLRADSYLALRSAVARHWLYSSLVHITYAAVFTADYEYLAPYKRFSAS